MFIIFSEFIICDSIHLIDLDVYLLWI